MLKKTKIISYENLKKARAKRVVKEFIQVVKNKEKRDRKSKSSSSKLEKDTIETTRRERKRKRAKLKTSKSTNKMTRMSNVLKLANVLMMQASRTQIAKNEIASKS